VLGDSLPGHVEVAAQLRQRLTVALVQPIEQLSTAFIRQGFEDCIHGFNMQLNGCILQEESSAAVRDGDARVKRILNASERGAGGGANTCAWNPWALAAQRQLKFSNGVERNSGR
jgi:hypothetical protein